MRYVVAIIFAIWLGLLYATSGGYLGGAAAGVLGVFGVVIALAALRGKAASKLVAHRGFFWTIIGSVLLPLAAMVFAGNSVAGEESGSAEEAGAAIGSAIGVGLIMVLAFFCFVVALVGWFMTRGPKPGELKTCPKCAEDVKSGAGICRHCGYNFAASEAPAVTA